jgi:type II secretory pathway component PulK
LFKNKRGVALILVLSTVAMVSVLIVDLNYNSRVTYTLGSNYKNSKTSYYLAKSSINIALLRIAIVNKLEDLNLGQIKIPPSVLEFIYSIPFMYPFTSEMFLLFGASDLSMGLKDTLEKINTESNISKVGSFSHQIHGLDSKININLVSKDENSIIKFIELMRNHYNNKIENDEDFGIRNPIEDYIELINNIIDWIDPDDVSRNGGSEDNYYRNYDYKPRNNAIPVLNELHLVEGMNDELFYFIEPLITVYSRNALNVNKMTPNLWKMIEYRLSDDDIKLIMEKINEEGGFTSYNELANFIEQNTYITAQEFNPLKIPLVFDDKTFKIEAKGIIRNHIRNMVAYVSKSYEESMGITNLKQNINFNDNIIKNYRPKIVYWELD